MDLQNLGKSLLQILLIYTQIFFLVESQTTVLVVRELKILINYHILTLKT